jgi:transposase
MRDLFQGDDGGWLQDVGLVDLMVSERLRDEAMKVQAEGWRWIDAAPDFPYGHTYDSDALRAEMEQRGVFANVRLMPQRAHKPPFSASLYKMRNAVERFFSKIKHYRAIATRYEKHPENYLALIKLAAFRVFCGKRGSGDSLVL